MSDNLLKMNARADEREEFRRIFEQGIAQFNQELFFETHETWEAIWLRAVEPERTRLQGLIQIAAAFHHYQHGNTTGAQRLLASALKKLENAPENFLGIHLEKLRSAARQWLGELERGGRPAKASFPRIETA
ncbi:MAG: DUF309 domain-containing protein [Acidobacteriia bacterium]|nr:DUF309 domain-containing protein [Terriglobia bacterium]